MTDAPSINVRKTNARRFDTIQDILRSLSLAQFLKAEMRQFGTAETDGLTGIR